MFDIETTGAPNKELSLLSVSGGGLLGVIPAAMLMRYEALGQDAYGLGYRLCDSFDSVAGTSTGAVIATGVALGLRAEDIVNFYLKDVPAGFRRRTMAVPLVHDLFDGDLMETFFERRTQGRLLERGALQCDLTILTKDLARGTSVAFTTLPDTRPKILGAEIRNEARPLSKVLRASTAAPGLFSPVRMQLDGVGPTLLADGGFSLFNDPSFLLSRLAQDAGAARIDMTVLGTGSSGPAGTVRRRKWDPSITRAMRALFRLIKDGEALTEGLMTELAAAQGAGFTCRRHDMCLSRAAFENLGFPVSAREARKMRAFADFAGKLRLFDIATRLAERTILAPLPLAGGNRMSQAIDTPDPLGANCPRVKALS